MDFSREMLSLSLSHAQLYSLIIGYEHTDVRGS